MCLCDFPFLNRNADQNCPSVGVWYKAPFIVSTLNRWTQNEVHEMLEQESAVAISSDCHLRNMPKSGS